MSPARITTIEQAEELAAGAELRHGTNTDEDTRRTPPEWFWRVIMATLGVTGIPGLGIIVVLWSRLAVIEDRIDGLRQAIQSSVAMQADVAALRAQNAALADRIMRIEARIDRQPGSTP